MLGPAQQDRPDHYLRPGMVSRGRRNAPGGFEKAVIVQQRLLDELLIAGLACVSGRSSSLWLGQNWIDHMSLFPSVSGGFFSWEVCSVRSQVF